MLSLRTPHSLLVRRRPARVGVIKILLAGLIAAPVQQPLAAQAQNTLRAAAVVNDEVISMLDLSMRTRLALLSAAEATEAMER